MAIIVAAVRMAGLSLLVSFGARAHREHRSLKRSLDECYCLLQACQP
jgi:hypothetical protein